VGAVRTEAEEKEEEESTDSLTSWHLGPTALGT
jgi:hypothetical protein